MKPKWQLIALVVVMTLALAPQTWAGGAQNAGEPAKTEVIKGISYYQGKDGDEEKNKLDLYLPVGKKNFPVVFFIHGGGWTKGTRSAGRGLGQMLAREGIGMVSISYRLSPQVKHPGHIEDVAKAFAWTVENIKKYGGNKDQIFVSGHSAGGHLAALLGTNESYLKKNKLRLANIKGVIPISGVFVISPGKISTAFGKDPQECKDASPMAHIQKNCPPFLILYAESDIKGFDKMASAMKNALTKAGVTSTAREMADRNHGTILMRATSPEDPMASAIIAFIREQTIKR